MEEEEKEKIYGKQKANVAQSYIEYVYIQPIDEIGNLIIKNHDRSINKNQY